MSSGYAGYHLFKFQGLSNTERKRIWSQYLLFAGFIAAGGVLGAAAWLSYMTSLSANFEGQQLFQCGPQFSLQTTRAYAKAYLWLGIFHFFSPLTFGCLTMSKLLVLDRILKFNSRNLQDVVKFQLERLLKFCSRCLLFLNFSVVIAAWTSMGLWIDSYHLQNELADQYTNNVPKPDPTAVQAMTASARRSAVAYFAAELIVLLALASSFLVFGGICIVRLSQVGKRLASASAFSNSHSSPASVALIAHASIVHKSFWNRVVGTVVSVFCSFIIRCVYNALYVSSHQASISPECAVHGNCAECQSKLFIISNWFASLSSFCHISAHSHLRRRMDFTPEFVASIILVSEPVVMLTALWAMSTHTKYRTGDAVCINDISAS
jgi:hypothetical protein